MIQPWLNRVAVIFLAYIGSWVIWALFTREQMFTTQSAPQYLPTAALKLQISVINACTMYERVLWFIPSTIIFEKTERVLGIIVSPLMERRCWQSERVFLYTCNLNIRKLEATCLVLLFSLRNSTLTSQIRKKEKIISHTTGTRTQIAMCNLNVFYIHNLMGAWFSKCGQQRLVKIHDEYKYTGKVARYTCMCTVHVHVCTCN